MKNTIYSPIYWSIFSYEDWNLYIAATSIGLCYVGTPNQPSQDMFNWGSNKYLGSKWIQDDERLLPYSKELIEYLHGTRDSFTIPFDFHGTPFQLAVWRALCEIPYGHTRTYSDIAAQIQKPSAVRAVGSAIGSNPILITVPCHRVIGKNGALTGYRGGLDMKTKLLQLERGGRPNGYPNTIPI